MDDERRVEQIREIFDEVRELPREERAGQLERLCQADEALRREVESLLESSDVMPGDFCAAPTEPHLAVAIEEAIDDPYVGRTIAGYELKELLGAGGMSRVYKAVQLDPRRIVAVKILPAQLMSRERQKRFRFEVDSLAKLSHPNIATLYSAGMYDDGTGGVPYFAMEYIRGARDIVTYADDQQLDLRARLELFATVCEAVAHGHQRALIHRDIKPDNILVDSEGRPTVIDFGIARATDSDLLTVTALGGSPGTPQYMSPEQASGDPDALTFASDVYSLGLVLYELVAGQRPYVVPPGARGAALERFIRQIAFAPPSQVASRIPKDLDTIVQAALAKEAGRRYDTAGALGADIRRLLRGEAISAERPTLRYQVRVLVRRNRPLVFASAAVFVALACGVAAVIGLYVNSEVARADAGRAYRRATRANAEAAITRGDIALARAFLDEVPPEERHWAHDHIEGRLDDSVRTLGEYGSHAVVACLPDGSRVGAGAMWPGEPISIFDAAGHLERKLDRPQGLDTLEGLALARIADRLLLVASGSSQENPSGTIAIWNLDASSPPGVLKAGIQPVNKVRLHRGRGLLAAVSNISVRLWSLEDPTEPRLLSTITEGGGDFCDAAFDESGELLAITGDDMTVRVWRVADPTAPRIDVVLRGHGDQVTGVAFRPGAPGSLATASIDGTVRLWDLDASRRERASKGDRATGVSLDVLRGHSSGVLAVAFSRDGRLLASAGNDRIIRIWRLSDRSIWDGPERSARWEVEVWEEITMLRGHESTIEDLAFGAQATLFSAGFDGLVKQWDARTPDAVPTLLGHGSSVMAVAIAETPAGLRIASGASDLTTRLWDPVRLEPTTILMSADEVASVAFNRTGELVASGDKSGAVLVWRVEDVETAPDIGPVQRITIGPADTGPAVRSLAFAPDRDRLAVAYGDGRIAIVDDVGAGSTPRVLDLNAPDGASVVAFSPNGRRLLVGSGPSNFGPRLVDHPLVLIDPDRRIVVHSLDLDTPVQSAAFSPDGRLIVVGTHDGFLEAWALRDGAAPRRLGADVRAHAGPIWSVAFLPAGAAGDTVQFATGGDDRIVKLWEIDDDRLDEVIALRGHAGRVLGVAFAPAGQFLASASAGFWGTDNSIKLWTSKIWRSQTLALAQAQREPAGPTLDSARSRMRQAWGIVKLAPMGGESDETACRKARELAILALDAYRGSVYEGWCQLTLGLSEYRLGELDAARVCLGTLLQLEDAATARRDASAYVRQPCASAALALVHHALGQDEEARAMLDETLARMRRLLAEELPTQHIDDPLKHYPDQDSIALYEEAKRAIEGQ